MIISYLCLSNWQKKIRNYNCSTRKTYSLKCDNVIQSQADFIYSCPTHAPMMYALRFHHKKELKMTVETHTVLNVTMLGLVWTPNKFSFNIPNSDSTVMWLTHVMIEWLCLCCNLGCDSLSCQALISLTVPYAPKDQCQTLLVWALPRRSATGRSQQSGSLKKKRHSLPTYTHKQCLLGMASTLLWRHSPVLVRNYWQIFLHTEGVRRWPALSAQSGFG